ncbi:25678_t:CDS:1, partial [Gigaspora rosea]
NTWKQATQSFKETADNDMVDVQLMYGDYIKIKALGYYRKAANNKNPTTMYKVGNIYYQ